MQITIIFNKHYFYIGIALILFFFIVTIPNEFRVTARRQSIESQECIPFAFEATANNAEVVHGWDECKQPTPP